MPGKPIDMTGKVIGELTVIGYADNGYWDCRCSCGALKKVRGYELRKGIITSCGHVNGFVNKFKDISNQTFGELTPIKFIGHDKWICKCSCGNEITVGGWELRAGKRVSCGHPKYKDLIGERFNDWEVIGIGPGGKLKCRCSCGKIADIQYTHLKTGVSKSCGHSKLIDLTGKQFGELTVLSYAGNSKWICKCSCGNTREILGSNLRSGASTSCGCKALEKFQQTMKDKYGETSYAKVDTNRTEAQIAMVDNRDNLLYVIKTLFDEKPTTSQLASVLGINETNTLKTIHKFNLEDYVALGWCWSSSYEDEILNIFPGAKQSDRSVLHGEEIDLLYKDKGIGIEFNGSYWHSDICKPMEYHKNKTLKANEEGIRLIHIFEYEWTNPNMKPKLINLINRALNNIEVIQGRKCNIQEVNINESNEFLVKYHLKGKAQSSINIGCYYNNQLIGIMSFGTPRFNSVYEYELIRLAWKDNIGVIGGSERLYSYFIKKYNPNSVISYCDISKFSGKVYNKLGFINDGLTKPSYVWINLNKNIVKSRYETTKAKLIKDRIDLENQTEEEIMRSLGYIKIYDCGNIRFVWKRNKET